MIDILIIIRVVEVIMRWIERFHEDIMTNQPETRDRLLAFLKSVDSAKSKKVAKSLAIKETDKPVLKCMQLISSVSIDPLLSSTSSSSSHGQSSSSSSSSSSSII